MSLRGMPAATNSSPSRASVPLCSIHTLPSRMSMWMIEPFPRTRLGERLAPHLLDDRPNRPVSLSRIGHGSAALVTVARCAWSPPPLLRPGVGKHRADSRRTRKFVSQTSPIVTPDQATVKEKSRDDATLRYGRGWSWAKLLKQSRGAVKHSGGQGFIVPQALYPALSATHAAVGNAWQNRGLSQSADRSAVRSATSCRTSRSFGLLTLNVTLYPAGHP
jgi:hypothetical protein